MALFKLYRERGRELENLYINSVVSLILHSCTVLSSLEQFSIYWRTALAKTGAKNLFSNFEGELSLFMKLQRECCHPHALPPQPV